MLNFSFNGMIPFLISNISFPSAQKTFPMPTVHLNETKCTKLNLLPEI